MLDDDEEVFVAPVSETGLALGCIVTVLVTVLVKCEVVVPFNPVAWLLEVVLLVEVVVLGRVSAFWFNCALAGSVDVEECLLVEVLLGFLAVVVDGLEVVVMRLVDVLLDVECLDDVLDFLELVEEVFDVVVDFFEVAEDFAMHERAESVESANKRLLIAW